MSNEYKELYELLGKIEAKLDNVESSLEKISGELTEWEREHRKLKQMIDDVMTKFDIKNDNTLI